MGKQYEVLEPSLVEWIERQHVFFVASAPAGDGGFVNLSPKGLDTLRVLDERRVAWLDFVGSGVETIAHLRQNGRVTLCFCAFEGPPRILRIHGWGEAFEPGTREFDQLRAHFPAVPVEAAVRSVIEIHAARIADSCGYGVPLYEYRGERSQLHDWADRKGEAGLTDYRRERNARSIEGLPALRHPGGPPRGT
ncbi:MAG TPA: pyridoxamine 5'-phosphate oxidase family protein [Myxococcota bacterium]|nr:pyridoxamine 5'-phosphate oxidase family protein [Myxococcota bacterium]